MSNNYCKSRRIQTCQLCVESSRFKNSEPKDLEELFQEWNGIIHICKKIESERIYVHFSSDELASVRYHTRDNASLGGEQVRILPMFDGLRPVHYAQPPISFPLCHGCNICNLIQ